MWTRGFWQTALKPSIFEESKRLKPLTKIDDHRMLGLKGPDFSFDSGVVSNFARYTLFDFARSRLLQNPKMPAVKTETSRAKATKDFEFRSV